jgi:hypothetical protein
LSQTPPQHWAPLTQTSPVWVQKEASVAHIPSSSQNAEQQSLLTVQLLPNVLQVGLRATQVLSSPQSPPQHSPSLPQLPPSDTH